ERAHRTERRRIHPQLPMRIDALLLAVPAKRAKTARIPNVCDALRDERKTVVAFRAQHPPPRVGKNLPPASPAQDFRIFEVVEGLEEVLFIPNPRTTHNGSRRVCKVRHA